MLPRRKNQPLGPAPPPNWNIAFDQEVVVGMIDDFKMQIEALAQRVMQRDYCSQDGNESEGIAMSMKRNLNILSMWELPRRSAPSPFDDRCWDGGVS